MSGHEKHEKKATTKKATPQQRLEELLERGLVAFERDVRARELEAKCSDRMVVVEERDEAARTGYKKWLREVLEKAVTPEEVKSYLDRVIAVAERMFPAGRDPFLGYTAAMGDHKAVEEKCTACRDHAYHAPEVVVPGCPICEDRASHRRVQDVLKARAASGASEGGLGRDATPAEIAEWFYTRGGGLPTGGLTSDPAKSPTKPTKPPTPGKGDAK